MNRKNWLPRIVSACLCLGAFAIFIWRPNDRLLCAAWAILLVLLCWIGFAIYIAKAEPLLSIKREWLKDFIAPLITPAALGLAALIFQIVSEAQKDKEAKLQRETDVMRQITTSNDRRDISHQVAVAKQLTIHLNRDWDRRHPNKATTNSIPAPKYPDPEDFDQIAAYFFYGLFRVSDVDLEASKGGLLFQRVWKEEAFHKITHQIIYDISGSSVHGDLNLSVSAKEEAAIYKYFGNNAQEGSGPTLFDFYLKITSTNADTKSPELIDSLRVGFQKFQVRLTNDYIDRTNVVNCLAVLDDLSVYSFNNIFAEWYGRTEDDLGKKDHSADVFPVAPPCNWWRDIKPKNEASNEWEILKGFYKKEEN